MPHAGPTVTGFERPVSTSCPDLLGADREQVVAAGVRVVSVAHEDDPVTAWRIGCSFAVVGVAVGGDPVDVASVRPHREDARTRAESVAREDDSPAVGLPVRQSSLNRGARHRVIRFGRSLKSWNTAEVPAEQRHLGAFEAPEVASTDDVLLMSAPPLSEGAGSWADLPEPEAPTMKTNSPFSMTNDTPSSAVTWLVRRLANVLEHDHRRAKSEPSRAGCRSAVVSGSAIAVICRFVASSSGTGLSAQQPAWAAPAHGNAAV